MIKFNCEGIDKNFRFLCKKTDIKNMFSESEIEAFFRKNRKIDRNGNEHIAQLIVSKTREYFIDKRKMSMFPVLNLYPISINEYSEELRNNFGTKILPMLFQIYDTYKEEDSLSMGTEHCTEIILKQNVFERQDRRVVRLYNH